MNTNDIDLSKPDAAAQKLAPELAAGYKTFSAATWALRLWKWVVRPVGRIAVGTLRGVWWLLKNGNRHGGRGYWHLDPTTGKQRAGRGY